MKTNTEVLADFSTFWHELRANDRETALKWDKLSKFEKRDIELLKNVQRFVEVALNQRTEDIVGIVDNIWEECVVLLTTWMLEHEDLRINYDMNRSDAEQILKPALTDITNKIKALYGVEK